MENKVIELSMTKNGTEALYELGGALSDGTYGFSKIITTRHYTQKVHVYSPINRTPNGEHALFHVSVSDHIIETEVKMNDGKINAVATTFQIVAILQDYKAIIMKKDVFNFESTFETIEADMSKLPPHLFAAISKAMKPRNKTIEFTDWAKYNKGKVIRFIKERQYVDMLQFTEAESNKILLDISKKDTIEEAIKSLKDVQYNVIFEGTRIKELVPTEEVEAVCKCA